MLKAFSLLMVAAACSAMPAAAAGRDDPDAALQKMLAGWSPGAPVSCISHEYTSNVTVIGGKAIVYRVAGRLFVNMPDKPDTLRDDDILVTKSYGSDICDHDVVQLVDRGSLIQHAFVVLGKFVPYTRQNKAR